MQFTTNGMCAKNNTHIYAARTNSNRVISSGILYCCLLPQCEALRTCRSGFPITTKRCCDQDVKVVPGADFTKRTCDRCGLLKKGGDVVATSRLALRWMCDSPRTGCAWRITPIYPSQAHSSHLRGHYISGHNSPVDWARELFKRYADSASLLVEIEE